MRWLVEAADTKTGQDTRLTVEALTAADAERLARYNGLLVSRISKAGPPPAPVVPYAVPEPGAAGTPGFAVLSRRARSTDRLGLVLLILGWVGLAGAVGVFAYFVFRYGWGDWTNWREWLPRAAGTPTFLLLVGGTTLTVGGSVLRLLAAAALAVCAAGRQGPQAPERADDASEKTCD